MTTGYSGKHAVYVQPKSPSPAPAVGELTALLAAKNLKIDALLTRIEQLEAESKTLRNLGVSQDERIERLEAENTWLRREIAESLQK